MASGRYLSLPIALVAALIMPATMAVSATRDAETGGITGRDCLGSPCSDGCWCPFDQWQEARLLKFGYGMTADREAAAYWYRRAAEKGDYRAAFNYGLMLIHGIGIEPDPEAGLPFLETAADASIQEAWFELGNLHRLGEHIAADQGAAIQAYGVAAEKGHVRAQHALANMYGNGQGAGIDLVTAYKWWRLAARKGHALAERSMETVTSMMTSAEISLGKRAAESWMAKRRKP